jgi:large subunit ribosomal protein L1
MARQNIDVIITVRDAASKPLDDVTKKIKGTGQAAKGATVDFIQFNKTLFTTGAFIATFVKGFEKLAGSLEQGAELDRLSIKYERVLGPKGLMPNPKNGTITPKPEEVAKKYAGGQINFKTEAKAPIMHLTVGKISFGPAKLTDNIDALIAAIKKANIVNVTLKSTMSPGLKIKI